MNLLAPILFAGLLSGGPLCISTAASSAPTAVTLSEAWTAAIDRTETVPISQTHVEQADAKEGQARGKFFPILSFDANYQQEDKDATGGSGTFFPGDTYTRVRLSQSLYAGGRDKASLALQKANKREQELNVFTAKLNTFSQVAQTFYGILSGEKDIQNIKKTLSLANDRIREIQKRTALGKARNIDLLAAQAQFSVLESQLKAAEGDVITAKDQFVLQTGLKQPVALIEDTKEVTTPKSIDTYIAFLEQRPDIKALRTQWEASQSTIQIARAGHFPSVDLFGNYYFTRDGSQKDNAWDASIMLSFPIFSGGIVKEQVHEANAQANEAELLLQQRRRIAETEIRSAHNTLMSAFNQLKPLETALKFTEQNFKEQEKNYRFGQATNLDVIQALNSYQDTKRTFDRTRYQTKAAWTQLNIATAQVE